MEAGVRVAALEVEVDKGTVAGGERRHILRAGEDMEVASKEMATALVEASTQAVEVEAMEEVADLTMGEDSEVTQVALGKVLVVLAGMVAVIMALVAPTKALVEVLEDQCRLGMMALERHSK